MVKFNAVWHHIPRRIGQGPLIPIQSSITLTDTWRALHGSTENAFLVVDRYARRYEFQYHSRIIFVNAASAGTDIVSKLSSPTSDLNAFEVRKPAAFVSKRSGSSIYVSIQAKQSAFPEFAECTEDSHWAAWYWADSSAMCSTGWFFMVILSKWMKCSNFSSLRSVNV